MPRKLPLCAWCGKSLRTGETDRGRLTLIYGGKPGKPHLGWHASGKKGDIPCFVLDELGKKLLRNGRIDDVPPWEVNRLLAEIERRGRGRVLKTKGKTK